MLNLMSKFLFLCPSYKKAPIYLIIGALYTLFY